MLSPLWLWVGTRLRHGDTGRCCWRSRFHATKRTDPGVGALNPVTVVAAAGRPVSPHPQEPLGLRLRGIRNREEDALQTLVSLAI